MFKYIKKSFNYLKYYKDKSQNKLLLYNKIK